MAFQTLFCVFGKGRYKIGRQGREHTLKCDTFTLLLLASGRRVGDVFTFCVGRPGPPSGSPIHYKYSVNFEVVIFMITIHYDERID